VRRDGAQQTGQEWSTEAEAQFRSAIASQYEHQGSPFYASARLWDDGIIDPAHTRRVLSLALTTVHNAPIEESHFGVFRM
jgi:3-methylcrotonyl-CoA carboxylase beta subunit